MPELLLAGLHWSHLGPKVCFTWKLFLLICVGSHCLIVSFLPKAPAFPYTDWALGGSSLCFSYLHSCLPLSLHCPCLLPMPGSSPSNPPHTWGLVNDSSDSQYVTSLFVGLLWLSVTHREKLPHLSRQNCPSPHNQGTWTCSHSNLLSPYPSESPGHPEQLIPKLPMPCSGDATIFSGLSLAASIIPTYFPRSWL